MAVALGCQPPPSFELRWSIGPDGPLLQAAQCSRVGLRQLQLLTYEINRDSGIQTLAAVDNVPCFPSTFDDSESTFDGPSVADGDYVVALRGLKNVPTPTPWIDTLAPLPSTCNAFTLDDPRACPPCPLDAAGCLEGFGVCDCQSLTVERQEDREVVDFILDPPLPCDDGIDNDRDGRVDLDDPSCLVQASCAPTATSCPPDEGTPVARNAVSVDFRWLGVPESETPAGLCEALGVAAINLVLEAPDGTDVFMTQAPCDPQTAAGRYIAADQPPGLYTLEATAVDVDNAILTEAIRAPVELTAGPGAVEIAFWGEDFVDPIRGSSTLSLCQGIDSAITHARVRVVGLRGQDTGVVDTEGQALDGTTRPCEPTVTEPLTFGLYAVQATFLAGDEPCFDFGDASVPLWPGLATTVLPPIALGGDGCPQCLYDGHCDAQEICLGSECVAR